MESLRQELLAAIERLNACELPVEESYYVRGYAVACVSAERVYAGHVVPVMQLMQLSAHLRQVRALQFHSITPEYKRRVTELKHRALGLIKGVETAFVGATRSKGSAKGSSSAVSLETRLRSLGESLGEDADAESIVAYASRMIDVLGASMGELVSNDAFVRVEKPEAGTSPMMLGNVAGMGPSTGCGVSTAGLSGSDKRAAAAIGVAGASKDGYVSFMESRSEVKPQQSFEDDVDNRNTRRVPRCDGLYGVIADDEISGYLETCKGAVGDGTAFVHPLARAIKGLDFQRAGESFKAMPSAPVMPAAMEDTPLVMVERVEDLEDLAAGLRAEGISELAVDLEAHNYRSFQGFCCLMQISTRDRDIIVDVMKLRKDVGRCLGPVFADPNIVKVLHGSNGDVGWLQRDFGVYICNLFDTGVASKALGYESNGLGHLLEKLCGFKADKRWQLADWRIRPLHSQAIHYARADTHFLLYCYDVLRRELGASGGLINVWEESRKISLTMYEKEMTSPTSFYELYKRMISKSGTLTERQLSVFAALYEWRDRLARSLDDSPGYLLPRGQLFHLARKSPKTKRELNAVMKTKNKFLQSRSSDLLAVIGKALKDTSLAKKALAGELGEGAEEELLIDEELVDVDGEASAEAGSPTRPGDPVVPPTANARPAAASSLYANLGIGVSVSAPALHVVQNNSMGNMTKKKSKRPQIADEYGPRTVKRVAQEAEADGKKAQDANGDENGQSIIEDDELPDNRADVGDQAEQQLSRVPEPDDGHLPFGTMDEDDFLPLPISQLTKKKKQNQRRMNDDSSRGRARLAKKAKVDSDPDKGVQASIPEQQPAFDKQAAIEKYSRVFAPVDTGRRGRGRGRGRGRSQKKQDNVGFIIPEGHFNPMARLMDGHPKGSSKRSATQVRSGNRSSTYRPRQK